MITLSKARFRFYGYPDLSFHFLVDAVATWVHRGNDVAQLEQTLAGSLGIEHAIAMPQARIGIYLVLKQLVTPERRRVVLSPYTIHDVINMVICAGAEPVFADIDPVTCNLDPQAAAKLIDDQTAAVLVTHLHGLACQIDGLVETCRHRGIPVIEDAAQAFGTRYGGRPVGTIGDVGIYSFGLAKTVNSLYGGMVVTRRPDLAEAVAREVGSFPPMPMGRLAKRAAFCFAADIAASSPVFPLLTLWLLRYAGLHNVETLNAAVRRESEASLKTVIPETSLRQMTPLQARQILRQLSQVDADIAARIRHARLYHEGLTGLPGVILPPLRDDGSHTYQTFALQIPNRHDLLRFMLQNGRDLAIQHMRNTADADCYRPWFHDCPQARMTADRVFLLPTYPRYGEREVVRNIELMRKYVHAGS